jgi:hypothetical protein
MTDDSLTHLATLANLEGLALHRGGLTDEGIQRLAALPKLKELDLTRCPAVTEAGVTRLGGALPNCRITWEGGVVEPLNGSDAGTDGVN